MSSDSDTGAAAAAGPVLSEGLGPALKEAAYDCMSALAGVETYDVNLRDHPEAWAAVEAFAAKVRAAERERWRALAVEIRCIEATGMLPDGDTVNTPTLLWAEEWRRRIDGPNVADKRPAVGGSA